jgi:hypothetical protein
MSLFMFRLGAIYSDGVVLSMIGIFDRKTQGLDKYVKKNYTEDAYFSQVLLLTGCKAFFIGYFAINLTLADLKNHCQDGIQYHSIMIL